jgi:zinc transport system permease protein
MLLELFSDRYFLQILFSTILIGLITGMVSVFVVSRHLSFLGEGLGHGSLLGIALAGLVGASPWLGSLLFALFASILLALADQRLRHRSDVILAVLFSLFLGLGVIVFQANHQQQVSIHEVLFGNLLLITAQDRLFLSLLTLALFLLYYLFRRPLSLFLIDEGFFKRQGFSPKLYLTALYIVIALVVVASLKVCGALLTTTLLTVPGAIAIPRSRSITQAVIASTMVGVVSVSIGILCSWTLDTPPGATTAVAAGVLFFLSAQVKKP